jgi:hypothetical protein
MSFPLGAPVTKTPIGATKDGRRTLTSQKLNPHKCSNPFQTNVKACKTAFSQSYVSGSIPCRLQSTASKHQLQWDGHAANGFSGDLLIVCSDGLSETQHPYTLLAPMMFSELLLRTEGCFDMLAPYVETICTNLRKAMSSKDTYGAGLAALTQLLQQSGNLLTSQMTKLVPVLARSAKDKKYHDDVSQCLRIYEEVCGPECGKLIKSKLPTY